MPLSEAHRSWVGNEPDDAGFKAGYRDAIQAVMEILVTKDFFKPELGYEIWRLDDIDEPMGN